VGIPRTRSLKGAFPEVPWELPWSFCRMWLCWSMVGLFNRFSCFFSWFFFPYNSIFESDVLCQCCGPCFWGLIWEGVSQRLVYHGIQWQCYIPEIHQIEKPRFLGISQNKCEIRFCLNLDLYQGLGVSRFGGCRGCYGGICSEMCHIWSGYD